MASIVELNKVQAVYNGNLESIQHDAALENGRFVVLNGKITDERELYDIAQPSDITSDEVLLHASPEVIYNETKTIDDFELPANTPGRAIHMTVGDEITLTDDAFDGDSVVGEYLEPQTASYKLTSTASLTSNVRVAFEVVEKTTVFNSAATKVRAIKV